MKILYLTDAERDYLADQIYDGLCAVLGRDCVIDFPRKELYHRASSTQAGSASDADLTVDRVATLIHEGIIDLVVVSSPRAGAVRVSSNFRRSCRGRRRLRSASCTARPRRLLASAMGRHELEARPRA